MGLTLVTPPAIEPVQLDDLKSFLRVSITSDDALLRAFELAARLYCENYTQRQFITATYKLTFDAFPIYSSTQLPFPFYQVTAQNTAYQSSVYNYMVNPSWGVLSTPNYAPMTFPNWGNLALPKPPLQSVSSILYHDTNNAQQTWASANYDVIVSNEPGYVKPHAAFPSTVNNISEAITINYVAGYGLDTDVPEPIKIAIKLLASSWYETRQPSEVGNGIQQAVHSLLDQYRFWGFN